MRQGKLDEALKTYESRPGATDKLSSPVVAVLEHRPSSEIAARALKGEAGAMANRDPEPKYLGAALDAFSGQGDVALRMLRRAVEQNYCGYPAMDSDPLFASIRNTPEFAAIRTGGIDRQKKFKAHIAGHAPQ